MQAIAKFHKVSKEQFIIDFKDSFPKYDEAAIKGAVSTDDLKTIMIYMLQLNYLSALLSVLRVMTFIPLSISF